ncbi:UDP-2,3-diacylglucosamine diphosphatase [Thorsellia kenyensis]|uniref:UDP-2,3-diacylglucosamine hydrolase n=1 Tax=Thorsellia kenyensis TaxID=1549888 RepID=A0ABV6C6Z5_9GAMM
MRKSLFIIADIHLMESNANITEGFLLFLAKVKKEGSALYILGDLFDAWLGDDMLSDYQKEIAEQLLELSQIIPCYFIAGNRDFLLGEDFAKKAGFKRIKKESILLAYNHKKYVLMHGDTLCTDDIPYQKYRKCVNNPLVQLFYRHLPKYVKYRLAKHLRERSKATNQKKSQAIMDVNQQAVELLAEKDKIDYLIHGHTHRPNLHKISLPTNHLAYRMVLGDWEQKGWYIQIDEIPQLIQFTWGNKTITPLKVLSEATLFPDFIKRE